jgi:hypothetical protein
MGILYSKLIWSGSGRAGAHALVGVERARLMRSLGLPRGEVPMPRIQPQVREVLTYVPGEEPLDAWWAVTTTPIERRSFYGLVHVPGQQNTGRGCLVLSNRRIRWWYLYPARQLFKSFECRRAPNTEIPLERLQRVGTMPRPGLFQKILFLRDLVLPGDEPVPPSAGKGYRDHAFLLDAREPLQKVLDEISGAARAAGAPLGKGPFDVRLRRPLPYVHGMAPPHEESIVKFNAQNEPEF